jgi:ribosomal protein L29
MFTLEELRKIDAKKLTEELKKVHKDLFKARFEVTSGQLKSSHSIKKNKQYIAQIKTIITERAEEKVQPTT